jgi:hypothetical protein
MKIKYVIYDECYPVLISEATQHADVRGVGIKVTSAGFCSFYRGEPMSEDAGWHVSCWGESVSLGIKSNPAHDQFILERLLGSSLF